ncbi:MAG: hypothetical protein WC326_00870 [Candidatus Delongbacteria bacterium]
MTRNVKQAARQLLQVLPYSIRNYNRYVGHFSGLLHQLSLLSETALRDWQFERFRSLAERAYQHSPFYRELYDRAGTPPQILRHPDDIQRLPLIDKDLVRANSKRLVLQGVPQGRLSAVMTSGTNGSPLTLYVDAAAAGAEMAAIVHQWERVGYRSEMGRIEFRGRVDGPELVVHFPRERILRVNINRLNPANMPALLQQIQACSYAFYHGYPSALERFARLLEQTTQAGTLRPPLAILLASEMVFPRQLELLASVFPHSRLFAHYGQAERVALGAWVGHSRSYHFLPGYAIVEQDEAGRLIGSSLVNEVMPLLRYRTTDVVSGFHPHPMGTSHLFPVVESIEGRLEDQLCTPAGDFVSPARVTFPFKEGSSYSACKLIQHTPDRLELVMESSRPAAELQHEFEDITAKLRGVFGPAMHFQLTQVQEIPRLPSGKFKWVESRV